MPKILYTKKKIGQSYLVWFQNSNMYLQLEEPAWFVFSKIVKGYKAETIAMQCVKRYENQFEDCIQFVYDIRTNIYQLNQSSATYDPDRRFQKELNSIEFVPHSVFRYRLSKNVIEFSYQNQRFESYFHPLISYLETDEKIESAALFELFEYNGRSVLRVNGEVKGVWDKDRNHKLIGFTYMSMVNEMYDKTDDFWLMTVHAAALTNGKKTILIPAESGSGKTTMAAMLHKSGYRLLSDDFVPIDRELFRAWHFPIAMSVKQGALDVLSSFYEDLEQKPIKESATRKIVRYISPDYNPELSDLASPIKDVISIKYDPEVEFKLEETDPINAIKLMLDQSWILPNAGNAGIFLDQVASWSFYQLTYSNNEKALDAISKIFDND